MNKMNKHKEKNRMKMNYMINNWIIIIWLIIMKNRRLNKKIKEEWNKNEINKLMMIT